MNIATYNVWNSDRGMPNRKKYIIDEIMNIKADIICLQEVHSKEMADEIASKVGYPYSFFDNYEAEQEGLCVLSKIPFIECKSWLDKVNAIYCSFLYNNKILSIVNIHLPWDSVAEREKQIIKLQPPSR